MKQDKVIILVYSYTQVSNNKPILSEVTEDLLLRIINNRNSP